MRLRRIIGRLARYLMRGISLVLLGIFVLAVAGWWRSGGRREGFVYGSLGGRFFVVGTDGAGRGKLQVENPWPVHQPLMYVNDPRFIGSSGAARSTDFMHGYPEFGDTLIERGVCDPYVAPDGVTPLLNSAAQKSRKTLGSATRFFLVLFPLRYLIWAAAVWPGVHVVVIVGGVILRMRRRRRVGMCAGCGYDLRAHGAGERCPECGLAVAAAVGKIA